MSGGRGWVLMGFVNIMVAYFVILFAPEFSMAEQAETDVDDMCDMT